MTVSHAGYAVSAIPSGDLARSWQPQLPGDGLLIVRIFSVSSLSGSRIKMMVQGYDNIQ